MDLTIKELEIRLIELEGKLYRGYNTEVEEEFLVTKGEMECWEKREDT